MMPRSKKIARMGRLQLATRDSCLPSIVAPKAPKVVTTANVAGNEACESAIRAAAVALCEITDPVDRDVLEGALGQAFASLNITDWEAREILFFPLGFWVLLQSGLLKAVSGVSLQAVCQDRGLLTYSEWQRGPSLRRVFETVLDQSMMRKYKRAIDEEEETAGINA